MGLTRQQGLEALLAGAQGSNPFVEGQQQRQTLAQQGQQEQSLANLKNYLQQQTEEATEENKARLAQEAQQSALQNVERFMPKDANGNPVLPAGAGISAGNGSAAITRQPNYGMLGIRQQQFKDKQEQAYSKAIQPFSDVNGALTQLETVTNRDGKGGIFTNPDASLMSAGKVESAIPDSVLGLGEYLGAAPKGTMEERKAIDRVKLSLGHAMNGARMNPAMQKLIQDSIGQLNSGDPQLMAKGLRGAARVVGGQINNARAGFTPDVTDDVDSRLGGNPSDFYNSIIPDSPAAGSKGPGKTTPPSPPTKSGGGTGPHGSYVIQNGQRFNWNPQTNQYE